MLRLLVVHVVDTVHTGGNVIALAAAVSLPALQFGALSSGGDDTVRQMAQLVLQQRTSNEAVFAPA